MSEPNRDPILEEVRENRRRLFEECGGTLEAFFKRLQQRDAEAGDTVDLSKPPRRPGDDSAASSENAA